jgi:hypothetical protein
LSRAAVLDVLVDPIEETKEQLYRAASRLDQASFDELLSALESSVNPAARLGLVNTVETPRLYTDTEVEAMPPALELVEKLAEAEAIGIMSGGFGVFKTWLARDLAYAIQTGRDFFGFRTKQGNVVFVPGEGKSSFPFRIRAWKHVNQFQGDAGVQFYFESINLLDERGSVARFIATCRKVEGSIALVIFDTVNACAPGTRENTEDMGKVLSSARAICRALQCAVLLIHHPPLEQDRPRGGVLEDGSDWSWFLKRDGTRVTINCRKAKNFPEFEPFVLEFTKIDGFPALVTAQNDRAVRVVPCSDFMITSLRVLHEADTGEGLATTTWLKNTGLKDRSFYKARKQLIATGCVEHDGKRNKLTLRGEAEALR